MLDVHEAASFRVALDESTRFRIVRLSAFTNLTIASIIVIGSQLHFSSECENGEMECVVNCIKIVSSVSAACFHFTADNDGSDS